MAPEEISPQYTGQPDLTPGIARINTPGSQLAFHETMEIHELLNFKTVCLVKSKMLSGLVFDQDLRALLEKDVRQSMTAVGELQGLYQAGPQIQ